MTILHKYIDWYYVKLIRLLGHNQIFYQDVQLMYKCASIDVNILCRDSINYTRFHETLSAQYNS